MRKLLTLIIFFSLALGGVAGAYQIQQGDTLSSIAKRFNTSVDELVALNDIENANVIYSGDFIETEGLLFGATPTPTSSAARLYVEAPDWQLFNGAAAGDTTLTIDDLEDIYGNEVSMGSSSKMYGRINPDGVTESISFSGITTNSDGTKTLTGVKSVLGQYPYTETSGLTRSHSIGALFRLTNTAGFYNDFGNKENDEIVEGEWLFNQLPLSSTSTPTDQRQLITLYQFQQATTTGGINGSETAKGVFEGATQADMANGIEFGSTGASLVLLSKYATSTITTTGRYLVVTRNSDGKIDASFGGGAYGIANLDENEKVYQNPRSATTTPTAAGIPIADGNGKLDSWITVPTYQLFGTSTRVYDAGTGTQVITHNLGFIPSNIKVSSVRRSANGQGISRSIGIFSTTTSQQAMYDEFYVDVGTSAETGTSGIAPTSTIFILKNTAIGAKGYISAVSTSTFTITWEVFDAGAGSPNGQLDLIWEVYR